MAQIRPPCLLIAAALLIFPLTARADAETKDAQARERMAVGDSSGALRLMREYVAGHPDDRAARLDLVRYLIWNGAYAKAGHTLQADAAAADSPEGRTLHAYLLADGGRIRAARSLNEPLLQADPNSFQDNYTQAVALRQSYRPYLALPYVEAAKRLRPGSKDALDLERGTRVRIDSFVRLGYARYTDSEGLSSDRPTLSGEYNLHDGLRLTMELGRWQYRAPAAGPFTPIDGDHGIDENRGLVGLRYAPNEYSELQFALGSSSIDGDGVGLWRVRGDANFSDSLSGTLLFARDRVAFSPRSLSLGLTRSGGEAQLRWTPNLDWTGELSYRRENYSDDNAYNDLNLALKRSALRLPKFSLDIGAAVQHMHYDFNPDHGYYAPDNYRRYGLTFFSYFHISDDAGLAVQGGLGRQSDETFTSWRSANDLSALLIVGIFSPWELRVSAGYSQRVHNTGAYEGRNWGLQLTRRF